MASKRSSKKVDKFYLSQAWQTVRHMRLKADNWTCVLCGQRCLGKRRGEPAPHVDHIQPRRQAPHLELSISNLRTLCPSCHSKVTRAYQLDRPEIGPDGYPV